MCDGTIIILDNKDYWLL